MSGSREGTAVLCIVAPFYNEAAMVDLFFDSLRDESSLWPDVEVRYVFVDDGSQDDTLARLQAIADRDPAVEVVALSRNFGHQIALTAGLDHATGDAVVTMDSDLQHPPALIAEMLQAWRQGSDVVSAVRQQTADVTPFKRVTSACFYWAAGKLSDTPIYSGACDFCLLSGEAHAALKSMPERHRFLRGMVAWIGYRRTLVPFEAPGRPAGRSKYTLRKMVRLATDGIFSFSTAPIRCATQVGALVLTAAFGYLCYILGRYWFLGDLIAGWSSLICTVLILNGIQLMFTGILGEYVARMFEESKQRPVYLVRRPCVTRVAPEARSDSTVVTPMSPAITESLQPMEESHV